MAVSYQIWDFPVIPIKAQLFHVPGAAIEGGYTSGGARILSPSPGGRSILETHLSFQVHEWEKPYFSWLISKTNGQIFKIPLTRTPQLLPDAALVAGGIPSNLIDVPWAEEGAFPESPWDNNQNWLADGIGVEAENLSLEGATLLQIDMGAFGQTLKIGHVIGHQNYSYVVDDIEYNGTLATIRVTPPLRKTVMQGDLILFRPYFLGTISNAEEFKAVYDASNVGHIQPGRIVFHEAIV